ncbi:MAG: phosphate ABC transporter permease subunit PstC [Firmicutes bacterium]|nr:phosphate ABC transporter permease subunit PstC [Bacillota bacterium]
MLAAAAVLAAAAAIAFVLLRASAPAISRFGPAFLVRADWDPIRLSFGALPFVWGTLYTTAIATVLAVAAGVMTALYLTEVAGGGTRAVLGFTIEFLAAIPSVIFGLWGLYVLIPWLRDHVAVPLSMRAGDFPLLAGPVYGPGMLAAGLVLAVMIVPTVAAVSREVFASVPETLRDAAYALGVTRWEMVRTVLLPAAKGGLLGAVVLAVGRAMGETMAVTMVIGNAAAVSVSLFAPGNTMSSVIANQFAEATERLHQAALMEIGLLLFLTTLLVNLGARWLAARTAARAMMVPPFAGAPEEGQADAA